MYTHIFLFFSNFFIVQVWLSPFPPHSPCPTHSHLPPSTLPHFDFIHGAFIHDDISIILLLLEISSHEIIRFSFFNFNILIMLLQLSHFPPLYSPPSCTPLPPSFPHLSSCPCPWIIHVSSLASPLPYYFLPSPCLFCTYNLCFLFPFPFPAFFPSSSPLITLHGISISVNLFLL